MSQPHLGFQPSKCRLLGPGKPVPAIWQAVSCFFPGKCWKAVYVRRARGSHLPHPPPLTVNEELGCEQSKSRIWPQIAEIHMKEIISVSPDACIENAIHRKVQNLFMWERKRKNESGFLSVQFSSVTQLCLTLCDPMNHSMSSLPVPHQVPKFTQTHVHRVSDAIQPSYPLSSLVFLN